MAVKKTVYEYYLANGLKVIVKEDHRAPAAIMQVWYKVGSSYETNGITGISHALEHMMFRGSKHYTGNKYDQIIAENGGEHNAFTGHDYTVYHQFIAKDKLDICFKLEADRMHFLSLQEQDFKKEISVVMEERHMSIDDSPEQLAFERFSATAHVASPYRHSIIGWMDDLINLSIEDLRKWYKTWYAPNNAIVVVAGDVVPKNIYHLTQKYFGSIKSRFVPPVKPQNEVLALGVRQVTIKVPAKIPWLALGYNTPVLNTVTKDKKWEPYALLALSSLLTLNNSSRLQKNIVRKKQIAAHVSSHYSPFSRIDTLFIVELTPINAQSILQGQKAIEQEIKSVQTRLVSNKELERIKIAWAAADIFGKDSLFNQAYNIGSLESVGISWKEGEYNMVKQIQAVTPKQIREVALKYLIPQRLTLGMLEPLAIKAPRS
jgi:zinc protease